MYALPLDGFNIFLGVQCLRSLGPIMCNFADLSMAFWRQGRSVQWTGVGGTTPRCTVITATRELLEALLDSPDLFALPIKLPPPRHDHLVALLPWVGAVDGTAIPLPAAIERRD